MKHLRFFSFKADLRDTNVQLRRIADAMERLSAPPGPDQPVPEAEQLTYSDEDAALLRELLEAAGRKVAEDEEHEEV